MGDEGQVTPGREAAGTEFEEGRRSASWREALPLLRGPLRPLVVGRWLGQGGDGLAQIAYAQVVLFEVGEGATPLDITQLLVVTLLPFSLVGPFAGVLIDRWDRRRTMITVSLLRVALVMVGIVVLALGSRPLGYAGILVLLSASRFILAAKGATLPRLVKPEELVAANSLSSVGGMVATFGGVVIGSLFVAVVPSLAFVIAAALYLLAALAFVRLVPAGGGSEEGSVLAGLRRVAHEFAEGIRFAATEVDVRRPLLAVATHRMLLGVGFIVLVLVADYRYDFEADGYGLAVGVTGVGAFIGTWLAPTLARRFSPWPVLPFTFFGAAVAAAVGASVPVLAVLIGGVAFAAVSFQILKVISDALIQHATPDDKRGRVVSVYDTLYNVAFILAGLALIPLWAEGREELLLGGLALAFAGAGAGMLALNRARRP
jgi:MFS family permease